MTWFAAKRARTLLAAGTVVLGLAAGAVAFWSATGSGEATTVLGSPNQLTLTSGTPQNQLSPGNAANVTAVATNSNPYFVTIDSLALDTADGTAGFDVDGGHSACDLSAIHFTPQDAPVSVFGPGWRVPPKVGDTDGTLPIELSDALVMDSDAANSCQGATFTVHLIAGN